MSGLGKFIDPQPYNQMQESIDQHPIFGRVLKENPHFQKGGKEINLMWDLICDRLNNKRDIFQTGEKKEALWSSFRSIYAQVESLFNHKYRSDGTPYFYHLLETAFILLEESELSDLRVEDLFVVLLHDIIEDTPQNYDSLWRSISVKGKEIAFGVHIISKPHFHAHIEDESELHTYKNCISEIEDDNIDLSGNIIDEDEVDSEIVEEYNRLKEKYKPIRNRRHFENYTDYETFKNYAKQEAEELCLSFSERLLDAICKRSVNVKLADRLHNLRTLGHMKQEKINAKIDETEKYLLGIGDEINPVMAEKLRKEIKLLRLGTPPDLRKQISSSVCNCIAA